MQKQSQGSSSRGGSRCGGLLPNGVGLFLMWPSWKDNNVRSSLAGIFLMRSANVNPTFDVRMSSSRSWSKLKGGDGSGSGS